MNTTGKPEIASLTKPLTDNHIETDEVTEEELAVFIATLTQKRTPEYAVEAEDILDEELVQLIAIAKSNGEGHE